MHEYFVDHVHELSHVKKTLGDDRKRMQVQHAVLKEGQPPKLFVAADRISQPDAGARLEQRKLPLDFDALASRH